MSKRAIAGLLLAISCAEETPATVPLEKDMPVRVNGCTVLPVAIAEDIIMLESSCEAPASAVGEQQWWGDGPGPPSYAAGAGDCIPMKDVYYCIELDPPLLRRSFQVPMRDGVLRRIRHDE